MTIRCSAARTAPLVCAFCLSLLPSAAHAWRQATTQEEPFRPLFVADTNCFLYSVHRDCSADVPLDDCRSAIAAGMDVWTAVDCAYLAFVPTEPATCCRPGYVTSGGNVNCLLWREDEWPGDYDPAAIALTTITYEQETGRILDADIEFNGVRNTFGVGCEPDRNDIANTVAHEAGHLLGLDHSSVPGTTMWPTSHLGDCDKRDLAEDDIAGICAIYPVTADPGTCREPPGGLDLECSPPPDDCGCRAAGTSASSSAIPLLVTGALPLLRLRRRARQH